MGMMIAPVAHAAAIGFIRLAEALMILRLISTRRI